MSEVNCLRYGMRAVVLGALAVGLVVLSGCAGNGRWDRRGEVERARFSAERSMQH